MANQNHLVSVKDWAVLETCMQSAIKPKSRDSTEESENQDSNSCVHNQEMPYMMDELNAVEVDSKIQKKLVAEHPSYTSLGKDEFEKRKSQISYYKKKPKKKVVRPKKCLPFENSRLYFWHIISDIIPDETRELIFTNKLQFASVTLLSKTMCALMNTGKPSVVYYGLREKGLVEGVPVTQEDRDTLRNQLDRIITYCVRPVGLPSECNVIYVPVVKSVQELDALDNTHPRFVVEIHLNPVKGFLYRTEEKKCYLREGDVTYLANMQDIRKHVAIAEAERLEHLLVLFEKLNAVSLKHPEM